MKMLLSLLFGCILSILSDVVFATAPTSPGPYTLPYTHNQVTYTKAMILPTGTGGTAVIYFYNDATPTFYAPGARIIPAVMPIIVMSQNDVFGDQDDTISDVYIQYQETAYLPIGSTCFDNPYVKSSVDIYQSDTFEYQNPNYFCNFHFHDTSTLVIPASNFFDPQQNIPLDFPLYSSTGYTPWTAPISSVMDQSMPNGPYTKDGVVLAFNGEVGDVDNGCWCYSSGSSCSASNYQSCSVAGYKNNSQSMFTLELNYSDTYLFYDGHPGYDYPQQQGTGISAPADGILCVATNTTQPQGSGVLWRDTDRCPLATAGLTTWSGYHTFYIIHQGLQINRSVNDYLTVFIHNDSLDTAVESSVEANGYAEVSRLQQVALVGDQGAEGHPHMHFEVYKWNASTSTWDRIDPYGDGTNGILWKQY